MSSPLADAGGQETVAHRGVEIAALQWTRVATDDAAMARSHPLTSPGERRQARRYRFEHDRRRFLARRGVVRQMLAARLGRDPSGLDIRRTPLGKPFLSDAAISFSVSYADDLVLLAVSASSTIGCDLAPRATGVRAWPHTDALFCANEVAGMHVVGGDNFVRAWTLKEACGKALGNGLLGALNDFDTTGICAKVSPVTFARREWVARSWELMPDYQAAIFVAQTFVEL